MSRFSPKRIRSAWPARRAAAFVCLSLWVLLGSVFDLSAAELPGGGQQQDYFIRQEEGESLLIRIDGVEADYEARVFDEDGELIIASGLLGNRLLPVFQYVPKAEQARQIDLRITAPFDTNRTAFRMGLSRISVRDNRSATLSRAYQWLSFGFELTDAETAANWSVKFETLNEAAREFQAFGMEELELWARLHSGQILLHGLAANDAALALADEVLGSPGARRRANVRLAATRLRMDALAALRQSGDLPENPGGDPVQGAAERMIREATAQGALFERADALFLSGSDLADRGQFTRALERFEGALEQAEQIDAGDLSTSIRERMVDIHGQQGNVTATSEVLRAIESQLTEDGANDELAQNLLAQGRILNATYRYEDARDVLRQALEFEHNSATRNQLHLALAEAAWALGDLDEARGQARSAVINPASGQFRRPTAVLDVQKGVGLLASVARARGKRAEMASLRTEQRTLLADADDRVLWTWERAQDALVSAQNREAAVPYLRAVRDTSSSRLLDPYGQLARLWLCRLGVDCPAGAAASARDALFATGIPRLRVEGGWLYGAWLAETGQKRQGATALESAVRDVIFFRLSIPGVLGDWYWRHGERLTQGLLDARRDGGSDDSLLMDLARLRWMRASGNDQALPFDRDIAELDTDALRAQLARRAAPDRSEAFYRLSSELNIQLELGRMRFDAVTGFLDDRALSPWLNTLNANEAVLDFDVSGPRALALLGTSDGVVRIDLGSAALAGNWREFVETTDTVPDRESWNRWVARWMEALAGRLPERVFLTAADSLALLPLEAARINGDLLADRHRFIRLASFPVWAYPGQRLQNFPIERVFLAGAPSDFRAGFLGRLETDPELRLVMDRFLGPGLQVIQGSALASDEFLTPAFQEADLVHLAVPVSLDRSMPEASWLELSEVRGGVGRERLPASGVKAWSLEAGLVCMSGTRWNSVAGTGSGRPPIISGALAGGARTVLASGWAVADPVADGVLRSFYDQLIDGRELDLALASAQRSARDAGVEAPRWARFQLWID